MYDYGGVDETKAGNNLSEDNYNWGYNPENYNVPEGSYSSDPYDGNTRITEMKEMIQALHDAGIKVIMDVVYNHTFSTEDSNFTKLMPDYYYKLTKSGKKIVYNDESGCGNATRSGAKMYDKYMRDSLKYWAGEYNIDGFRFDLMGIHDAATMNNIRKDLDDTFGEDTIVMYGEGWTGNGSCEETSAYKTYAGIWMMESDISMTRFVMQLRERQVTRKQNRLDLCNRIMELVDYIPIMRSFLQVYLAE